MRIGELAEASQIPAKTIRYYESVGLMPPTARSPNGYRQYSQSDLDRLVFIRRCRDLNIPLDQVQLLVRVQVDKQAPCSEVDQVIHNQLEKVRATLKELQALESTLSALGRCENKTIDDCQILRQLNTTAI